jgi:hypothetical protein
MNKKRFFILIGAAFLLPMALLAFHGGPDDHGKAAPDGPYVFHRAGLLLVKTTEMRDTGISVRTVQYTNRDQVLLTCKPNDRDHFSFLLKDTLKNEPDQYDMPAKMLALSDIEGNFEALKLMLTGAKIIDDDFKWRFGKGHLVLVGDFFDRGNNVTECLWLVYKLEIEAEAAGGKVHFILGNHEILNLQGVTEYVRGKYIANAYIMGEEYIRLFDANTELGRWLRTKNAIEKIGDFVFCHGGLSPELAKTKLALSDINRIARQHLGKKYENIPAGNAKIIFDKLTGVFWYREAAKNKLTNQQMVEILDFVNAKRMVVGHTLVPDLTAQYGGRLICIDLYHEENMRRGFMKSLWVENGNCFGMDSRGQKTDINTIMFPEKQD